MLIENDKSNNRKEHTRLQGSVDLLKKISVLYVEDDAATREHLSRFLERRVGKLYTAANGQEGLETWRRFKPEVVVTDIMMPVMDGLRMAEMIRLENPSVPVIVTTAFNEMGFMLRAIDLGIDKYVTKPINTDLLLQAINNSAWGIRVGLEMQLASTVFDVSSDAIIITDSENRIIDVNAAFCEITGYSKEEALGQTPTILSSGIPSADFNPSITGIMMSGNPTRDDAEKYHALWERLKETGRWSGEAWSRRKNGEIFAEWLTINTVKNSLGETTHHVAIFTDITEHKIKEAELEQHRHHLQEMIDERTLEVMQAKESAEIANRAKSEFLATMSHEIRTPMNGVVGMVDILQETRLTGDQHRMVRTIRESSIALLGILNDIMDFSKIEAGKLTIENIPTNLREVSEGVAELLAPVAAGRDIDLYVYVSPDTPAWILSDPVRLRQILFNLLGNALKFTHGEDAIHGNKVFLSVESFNPAGGCPGLRLRVIDNGIGMTPDTVAQLFQPFTQADSTTTRRFGGTGLGLSITKRLVDMLDGQIFVHSTPGAGSEFTVEIPLLKSGPGRKLPGEPDLTGVRVLAVTSDPVYEDILPAYLRCAGAETAVISDMEGAHRQLIESADGAVLVLDHSHSEDFSTGNEIVLTDKARVVQLIRRSGIGVHPKAVTVTVSPLLYHDLISGVAIAAGLLTVKDSVRKTDQRKRSRRIAPTVEEAVKIGQLILLAEDNETNCEVIQEQLRLLGYASEAARDGRKALDMWRSGRYALLLTDYHMPYMDGYQLAEAIRQEESRNAEPGGTRFPIIAVTANAMQGEEERCLENGMDDYLSKPLRLDKLGSLLAKWLPLPEKQPEKEIEAISDAPAAPNLSADSRSALVIWDVTMLTQLVGDNPAMHRRLLDKFLFNSEKQVAEINAAVVSGQTAGVMEAAHKLKSSARTVGAMRFGALCQDMETAARAGDMQSLQALASGLDEIFLDAAERIRRAGY
ncbi:MAG: hypothetical protein A2V79_07670 [Betaproteobacteria bacterium RBG_16_56_24]|nr:MAG: hypothetical protein A2V79_07670 [Betaproteobacteria bacterium RBG_16_56_24]